MKTWTCDGVEVREYRGRVRYAPDPERWPDDQRYAVEPCKGVAFFVLGWEVEPTAETEWDGIEERTARVLAVMVGDDTPHRYEPEDLTPLGDLDYCATCGQVGCTHDGRVRP